MHYNPEHIVQRVLTATKVPCIDWWLPCGPVLLFVWAAQVLVDELREKCLEERVESSSSTAAAAAQAALTAAGDKNPSPNSSSAYSSLTTSPDDWKLDQTKPCSGERLLLMFDRWVEAFRPPGRGPIQCQTGRPPPPSSLRWMGVMPV